MGEATHSFSIVAGVTITSPTAGQIVRLATPTFTGVAEPGDSVEIFLNDATAGTTLADENGAWSFSPSNELTEGTWVLRVSGAGQSEDSVSFQVDTTRTGLVIDEPAEDAFIAQSIVTFRGSSLANSAVSASLADTEMGEVMANANGLWEWKSPTLPDGTHTFTFTSSNEVGEELEAQLTLTIDTTAPRLEVTTPKDGEALPEDGIIKGTSEAGTTIQVFLDGELVASTTADASGNWSLDVSSANAESSSFRVTATDEAGNTTVVEFTLATQPGEEQPVDPDPDQSEDTEESGCGGCSSTNGSTSGFWLVLFGTLFWWRRRR